MLYLRLSFKAKLATISLTLHHNSLNKRKKMKLKMPLDFAEFHASVLCAHEKHIRKQKKEAFVICICQMLFLKCF